MLPCMYRPTAMTELNRIDWSQAKIDSLLAFKRSGQMPHTVARTSDSNQYRFIRLAQQLELDSDGQHLRVPADAAHPDGRRIFSNEELPDVMRQAYDNTASGFVGRDRFYAWLCSGCVGHFSRDSVMQFLRNQECHQLQMQQPREHGPVVQSRKPGRICVDLVDMSSVPSRGMHWILTAVDQYTRFLCCQALRNKEAETVLAGLREVVRRFPTAVSVIQSDNGSEFIADVTQQWAKDEKLRWVFSSPGRPTANAHIERANGSLKRVLYKYMQAHGTTDWPNALQDVCDNLNGSVSASTGRAPMDVTARSADVTAAIEKRQERNHRGGVHLKPIAAGDSVRVRIERVDPAARADGFRKSTAQQWSSDLYTVLSVSKPKRNEVSFVPQHRVDVDGVTRVFYRNDLLLVDAAHLETSRVKRVPRPRAPRKKPEPAPAPPPPPPERPHRKTRAPAALADSVALGGTAVARARSVRDQAAIQPVAPAPAAAPARRSGRAARYNSRLDEYVA